MRPLSAIHTRLAVPALIAATLLCACQRDIHQGAAATGAPTAATSTSSTANAQDSATNSSSSFTWPATLRPFGDGYPNPGDPCRRLGETPAVADFLDHTTILVGCPGPADRPPAATLVSDGDGKVVAMIDGVTVITLPPNAAL
ncbi:MAG TPA: hypothetical protein VD865_10915 [Stenotrophomonas sp.]|nr:hypothetical protein [Stenotrophomonas sp.]